MFKNMKIKVSLFLGFGITILVSVAIISILLPAGIDGVQNVRQLIIPFGHGGNIFLYMLIILNNQSNTYVNIINSQVKANELILTCRN